MKCFSHILGNSDGSGCKVIYEEGLPNIWGNAQKYLTIDEEAVSHMWICNCSLLKFLIYEEIFFFFLSDYSQFIIAKKSFINLLVLLTFTYVCDCIVLRIKSTLLKYHCRRPTLSKDTFYRHGLSALWNLCCHGDMGWGFWYMFCIN